MIVSAVGGAYWPNPAKQAKQNVPGEAETKPMSGAPVQEEDAAAKFVSYMKKTPAQKMQEAWLQRHGITAEEFAQMTGPEKQALIEKMQAEIKEQAKRETEEKVKARPTNILV